MKRHSPPCHHCPRREVGCHAWCEEYAEYSAQRQEMLARKYTISQTFGDLIAIWRDNMKKKRGHQ